MRFKVDPDCINWFSAPVLHAGCSLNSSLYAEPDNDTKPVDAGGYNAVAFSYGNNEDFAVPKNSDSGLGSSPYCPPFPVPVDLVIVSLYSSMFYTLVIPFWPQYYCSSLLLLTLCGQMIYV